ncbi:MAG: ribosome small subunit-dependent GTPase A [Planctomycetes bacterium]|nr:ribosome small subunit-dependent GTPase A [Planctomycetota bacterium]
MPGQVTKMTANVVEVKTEQGVVRCGLRGRLKKERLVATKLAAVGDEVEIEISGPGEGTIHEIRPRRTKLSRPDPLRPSREQIIAANVDTLIIVMAAVQPEPDLLTIDKCTVMASAGGVVPALCMNKIDVGSPPWLHMYSKAGIPVFRVSAMKGDGLAELRAYLAGKLSVFLGPSGVGKSTLLNAMKPGLALKTREVSERTGEGRHTTTWAEVVEVDGARVIDTPGLEVFGMWGVTGQNLREHFKEFPLTCKFRDCSHTNEPKCAVREGVERGEIHSSRYESYLKIRQMLVERPRE